MDSATWRRRIVSQLSCQTRQQVYRGLNKPKPNVIKENNQKSQNYREAV
jgi:hypothetical protein